MSRMELPVKRKRVRPKMRFMYVTREDMAVAELTEEDAEDRTEWRLEIRCGDHSSSSIRHSFTYEDLVSAHYGVQ